MNEFTKNGNDFIGYEYKEVTVKRDSAALFADSYQNFGWTLEGADTLISSINSVVMKFKRDRKIRNKAELTRLQRQFESQIAEIEALERSKEINASAAAYGAGIAGTAFMAGAVFAITANTPNVLLCVILAIPGFVGWILPYFLHKNIRKKKTEKTTPLIDIKYDEIYEICEKANGLLAK